MQISEGEVTELFRTFDQAGDIRVLRKALALIENLGQEGPGEVKTHSQGAHADKLQLLLAAFNHIDAKIKPDFNFRDLPAVNIAPPPETGLPAGVDPSGIADPTIRARYETEIAANQAKAKLYEFQLGLRKAERTCTDSFDRHVYMHYTKSSEADLAKLIDETVRSKTRRAALKGLLSTIFARPR
ncbi:MAG: hypothetical protein ABSB49_16975 [Polyangia bacterium]|jgi:hypothetical protein